MDEEARKIAAHQITASDLNTFTNTFLINKRMKFVMTTTTKSGGELISLKETFGLCTLLRPRESNLIHVRT